ncbi:uncharacterized protein BP01DRAFT_361345 [Aspergillus saccharolyticus JOP 1030-1]|uniref:Uncharacterized protein n=1 Tax=Aspergillus saccharolyticus JOP 1030-1 TaxID=1450539 RepID=A0A318Z088_9EURO|nr:hypothetical protein BP01DRAFT_361345 [Aspergillus saccharolyticus JOP 1030-1]PYH40319.1 hypothetical protein BP01DRAFT_361345 [Aspergillus saccharolyticus JOP 1030-1]
MSLCTICFDNFCVNCTQLVAAGAMAIDQCSTNHVPHFVYVPPRPKPVARGIMVVDGEEMDFETWKNRSGRSGKCDRVQEVQKYRR